MLFEFDFTNPSDSISLRSTGDLSLAEIHNAAFVQRNEDLELDDCYRYMVLAVYQLKLRMGLFFRPGHLNSLADEPSDRSNLLNI